MNPSSAASIEASAAARPADGTGFASAHDAKCVLVVEDNPTNMKLFSALLHSRSYRVLQAMDGRAGIAMAREHHPDLIVMDIQLPEISGIDATRILKAEDRTRAIPVVAVTAFAMPGDEAKVLASGCDMMMTKPIAMREFLDLVGSFLLEAST